jgi:hypothetical protein
MKCLQNIYIHEDLKSKKVYNKGGNKMSKLYYCVDCRRVFKEVEKCEYCNGQNVKELVKNSPVNVIGSKLKGKILKIEENKARLLMRDEKNDKYIKEYEAVQLRKVL